MVGLKSKRKCLIGTSGFYYNHWYGKFYPEKLPKEKLLSYFAGNFNTVELNSTFYHLPKEKTVENWFGKVPEGFTFAVKASRFITHVKKLVNLMDSLDVFLKRAYLLREKLGPVLYQLPPALKKDTEKLANFIKKLPSDMRSVIEFRNPSWLDKEVFNILRSYNVAHCIISMPNFPIVSEVTSDFIYIRMHGGSVLYNSNYSQTELKSWAKLILDFLKKGLDVYIYFNNDANAYAVRNALTLKKFCGQ